MVPIAFIEPEQQATVADEHAEQPNDLTTETVGIPPALATRCVGERSGSPSCAFRVEHGTAVACDAGTEGYRGRRT